MKKILIAVSAVAFALAPLTAQAASFAARNQYTNEPGDHISGSLYVAAGTITLNAPVGGDALMAGGTVTVLSTVAGNIEVAGGTLMLMGPVQGSVRAFGGSISINGHVSGDVIAIGGTISLLPNAVVDGGVYAIGGRISIDSLVRGSVDARGNQISLGANGHIYGNLTYRSPKEAQMDPGSLVAGAMHYIPTKGASPLPNQVGGGLPIWGFIAALTTVQLFAYLGAVLLVVWVWRRRASEISQAVVEKWWPSVGHGLVYLILAPICAVLLLVSVVGSIVGIAGLLVFIIAVGVAKVFTCLVLGAWLEKVFRSRSVAIVTWQNALVGTLAVFVLTFIPIIGWVAQLLLFLATFGVIAQRIQKALA